MEGGLHDLAPVDGADVAELVVLHDLDAAPEDRGEAAEAEVLQVLVLVDDESPILEASGRWFV